MITRIDLEKFKCFDILRLPLSSLTVLSGANASGKSSVLQAFALLHQTMRENEWSKALILNGTAVQLGTVLDVVDKVHGRHGCSIGLIDGDSSYRWTFTGDRTNMSMSIEQVVVDGEAFDSIRPVEPHYVSKTVLALQEPPILSIILTLYFDG